MKLLKVTHNHKRNGHKLNPTLQSHVHNEGSFFITFWLHFLMWVYFLSFRTFLCRSTNATSCGDQSPPGFIGKVDGGVGAAVAGVYSRVPYDSWPFNAMSGAHTGIKPDVSFVFSYIFLFDWLPVLFYETEYFGSCTYYYHFHNYYCCSLHSLLYVHISCIFTCKRIFCSFIVASVTVFYQFVRSLLFTDFLGERHKYIKLYQKLALNTFNGKNLRSFKCTCCHSFVSLCQT